MPDDEITTQDGAESAAGEETTELALAIREERSIATPPAASLPSEREWKATIAVATEIARTTFVPDSYRGQPEAVVAAILTGRELGIGPMQSLRDIYMIDGRPVFSASLMLAQMRRRGVEVLESESTLERAMIRARRSDTGEEATVEWTFEEAEKITRRGKKLVDGDNWKNYRQDMLWARAVGRLARRLGSDLLAGMVYSSEELRDLDGPTAADTDSYSASTTFRPPAISWDDVKAAPGTVLHPDAPSGWREMADVLTYVDPALDWKVVVAGVLRAAFGAESVAQLTDENRPEAGRRLANLAGYLRDVVQEGKEFPPPPDEQVVEAVALMFDGLIVDLPERALEADEVVDPDEKLDEGARLAAVADEDAVLGKTPAEVEDVEFGETK